MIFEHFNRNSVKAITSYARILNMISSIGMLNIKLNKLLYTILIFGTQLISIHPFPIHLYLISLDIITKYWINNIYHVKNKFSDAQISQILSMAHKHTTTTIHMHKHQAWHTHKTTTTHTHSFTLSTDCKSTHSSEVNNICNLETKR